MASLMLVPELNDMETKTIHIEVNVPLLEIRSTCLPNAYLRMHDFDGLPCCLTQALAVHLWLDKQYLQFAFSILFVNLKNQTANHIAITDYTIGFGLVTIDATLDSLP